jgi:alkylation response protein AidB-like acyl-CoA dehydrogenase
MPVREEALAIARELADCPRAERFDRFFARIRDSRIPYLACQPDVDPERLYHETFDALMVIGSVSLPLAVGFTMHQYLVSTLATMPVQDASLRLKTERLLRTIEERRMLLAIGSVGDNIKKKDQKQATIAVHGGGDGRLAARGKTAFQCMGSQADLLGFIGARPDGELGFYLVELKNNPAVTIGPRVFSDAMSEADTRSISIEDAPLLDDLCLIESDPMTRISMYFGTAWFEALIPAAYLGGAMRALDEAAAFARSVDLPDGTSLAELDGAKVELGRLAIQLKASLALMCQIGNALAAQELDPLGSVEAFTDAASIAKYTCTRTAEDIVQSVRRFIGTRGMTPNAVVSDLSQQIVFGPLHPKLSATVERGFGERTLRGSFLDV